MRLLTLPGCWYVDALPSGPYAAARLGDGVQMEGGTVGGHAVQWVRIAPDGMRFAGTGANDSHAWEWDGSKWNDAGPFIAPRAVLYPPVGPVYVERVGGWPGSGSQGWRYIDDAGVRVPAWSTYVDGARQIDEYTTRGDVTIGQGATGGVVALVAGKRIRLDHLFRNEDGSLRFGDAPNTPAVNFNKAGSAYAVAWYVAHSPTQYTACIVWLSDAELRALPDVFTAPAPVPVPVPVPIPLPQPHPIPEPKPMTDHTDIVRAIRSRYPAKIDDPTCFAIVNEAAKATAISAEGWGLLKCPPGARGFVVAGQNYRVQRLCKPDGTLVQLLGSSGSGDAIAEWAVSLNDPNATAENWAPPVGADQSHPPPLDPPVVVVTPPVIVAPADTSARDAHIFALLRSIQVAIVAADQHNVAKLEEIKAAFIKSSKDIGTVLGGLAAGGGVTGLLGGLLNKK